MDTVHLYVDESGEWRWRRQSENGRIVADSSEGYLHFDDCKDMARDVNGPDPTEGGDVEYVNDEGDSE
jgi:uncharacterized protein YegP (UPF0339 family)